MLEGLATTSYCAELECTYAQINTQQLSFEAMKDIGEYRSG
jgi:hypothetical protein